ncbi:4'-phosphopantetheinyl transferase [Kribbella voronezhensis]|uniref:4'-phosphopantetheinyl transferase n=1 Tax=Kribbella voronezhensis TaxID=2512212 RepID=A0A4R7T8T7_9ACTN|nr:4'-phosphopantetheinyl transferase superfamily protein [Kribbella voronezhensis]TDU87756.1 4'-phosphopantetheinyl transferase [Kribbella voronezhensis]
MTVDAQGFPPPPTSGAVHLFRGRAPTEPAAADLAILDAAELERFARMVPSAGAQFAGSRAAVRRILAGYVRETPGRLGFGRRSCPGCGSPDHGPPQLIRPATRLAFSLSRSDYDWLLAVTADRLVGVDIEGAAAVDFERVAPMVMTPAELAALRAEPEEQARKAVFLRCWTRKEAVLKASGIGLMAPLREIDVLPASSGLVTVSHEAIVGAASWSVQDLPAGSRCVAALAVQAGLPAVEISWPAVDWQQLAAVVS